MPNTKERIEDDEKIWILSSYHKNLTCVIFMIISHVSIIMKRFINAIRTIFYIINRIHGCLEI